MNNFVPNWDMEDDYRPFHDLLPPTNQTKSTRADQELIELVWQNGHVVMQNQSNRTRNGSSGVPNEFKQASKPEVPLKCGGNSGSANNFLQEEETAPWLQYPLGDPLDKDFCSDLFFGMPVMESIAADKLSRETLTGGRNVKFGIVEETEIFADPVPKQTSRIHIEENIMPPPKPQPISNTISPGTSATDGGGIVNFAHFSRPTKIDTAYMNRRSGDKIFENGNQRQVGESSSIGTKLSANCGSNQVQNQPDLIHTLSNSMSDAVAKEVEDVHKKVRERGQTETHDTATVTSSSAGSGSSVGRTCPNIINNQSHKRKGRDAEESDCHSEETEFQSDEAAKPTQRSASARRSRAAEVHNLSERRRRDRINEKMKALQELIPHCNKTDKASMLDEAIEYLKSLQLQVQMMWMGNGMAPMMFPSPQHYLSLMGRGMGHGSMPSLPSVVQMPRVTLVNQSMSPETGMNQVATTPPQTLNQIHPPNQMQNSAVPDAYTRYLGFHQMQQAPQVMRMFSSYGPQLTQANHAAVTAETNNLPSNGKSPTEIIQNGKIG